MCYRCHDSPSPPLPPRDWRPLVAKAPGCLPRAAQLASACAVAFVVLGYLLA